MSSVNVLDRECELGVCPADSVAPARNTVSSTKALDYPGAFRLDRRSSRPSPDPSHGER